MAKNPLLEAASGEDEAGPPPEAEAEIPVDSLEEPTAPGADELMVSSDATSDQPLDFDWNSEALETDSFSDVGREQRQRATTTGPTSTGWNMRPTSLAEHLLDQLHGAGGQVRAARARDRRDARRDRLSDRPAARHCGGNRRADRGRSKQALALVQDLDPPGVGARNLAECLALQAKAADRYDPAMARLIDNLDLLAKGRMADLKRICGVDDEDLADMVRELRAYDPKPGCHFSAKGVESVDSGRVHPAHPRRLCGRAQRGDPAAAAGQPPLLSGAQDRAAGQGKSKAWLSECLASANWLVKALDQRARTIVKVVSEIVEAAAGLLRARRRGDEAADPCARSPRRSRCTNSTISRVTSNKYLLCDRGLFELKYFFGSGVASTDEEGEGAAAEAVKAAIGELIANEVDILSDDAIAGLLKQRGFDCARRTVVKYREAMGIGSSIQRRRRRKIAGAA